MISNVYDLDNKRTLENKYLRVFSSTPPCYSNVTPIYFQPVHFPSSVGCHTEESSFVALMDKKLLKSEYLWQLTICPLSLSSFSLSLFFF